MTRIDIAIIGSGPAGLEAALTAKNRNKSIMVFGSKDLSPKMVSIEHPITNYLGISNVTGRADVLLYAEPTNSQPDREHRVSESGHGHDRERLLLFLERIQRRSEDTGVQG